jgi:Holliday junction resolvase RusA-like endonuclease
VIAFTVFGVASTMGSKKAIVPKGWTRAIVTDSNRNLKAWQTLVSGAASRAIAEQPDFAIMGGAVRLVLQFYLPRPKSIRARVVAHTTRPDTSKLVRATEDALTGVVYRDDAQVVELRATKAYTLPTVPPHVFVSVEHAEVAL